MSQHDVTFEEYYKYYQLEQDPFPASHADTVYYATPELEHRLELAKHLVDFSDRVLLLNGVKGSGKTAFLERLKAEADERWVITELDMTGGESPETVLESICRQNHLAYDAEESPQAWIEKLGRHLHNNTENGLVNVFLIDNADRLTAAMLNLLLQLGRPEPGSQRVHLVLASEGELASLFLNENDEFLHKMEIPLLSMEQLPIYLRHRLGNADIDFKEVFGGQQLKRIYQTSGGIPALVNQLAARTLQDPSRLASRTAPRRGASITAMFLNLRFTLVLSLVLVCIFVVIALNREEGEAPQRIELPLPDKTAVTLPPERQSSTPIAPVTGDSEPPVTASPAADDAPEPEPAVAPVTAVAEPIEVNGEADTVVTSAADTSADTATLTVASPIEEMPEEALTREVPAAKTVREAAEPLVEEPVQQAATTPSPSAQESAPGFKGAAWLKQQPPGNYVLQLIGAHDPEVINKVLESNPSIYDQVARFTTVNNNRRWYVLVYGLYKDRDSAVGHIPNLPERLRALGPWPRSLASIQQDLQ